MFNDILLILALNIDTFCFGASLATNNIKIKLTSALIFNLLALVIFLIPIFVSKFISRFLTEQICRIIVAVSMFLLAFYYLTSFLKSLSYKNSSKNGQISQENEKNDILLTKTYKTANLPLKMLILSVLTINIDTLLTNLIIGFNYFNTILASIIFLIVSFLALIVSNYLTFLVVKKLKINLSWISAIIFLILGFVKIFE